jgi:hypothetical protein
MNRFVFFMKKIPSNKYSLTEVVLIFGKPFLKKNVFVRAANK